MSAREDTSDRLAARYPVGFQLNQPLSGRSNPLNYRNTQGHALQSTRCRSIRPYTNSVTTDDDVCTMLSTVRQSTVDLRSSCSEPSSPPNSCPDWHRSAFFLSSHSVTYGDIANPSSRMAEVQSSNNDCAQRQWLAS